MAQSYAPQAEQRVAVVEAISEALAISSPQQAGRWLPLLGRLSRDPDSTVRLATVQTLAAMPGQRSLPWLRRALQDSEPDVVAAAHEAISRFKGRSRPKAKQKARRLPKNR
jgi:HEAT repeat protein